jgi:hypothetical protein
MRRRRLLAVILSTTLWLLATTGPAAASAPQPVTITVLTGFDEIPDPFDATGDIVCDEGVVSNTFSLFTGWQSDTHAQILVGKHFVCSDGTFDILLRVKLSFATQDTAGTWSVQSGTGAYAGLHGTGMITGDNMGEESILDVFTGSMHID